MHVTTSSAQSPATPWLSIFPESSRFELSREHDLYTPGNDSDLVFVVEHGAIVEIRTNRAGTSHAVGLSGREALLGSRLSVTTAEPSNVRAIALTDTVLRAMKRTAFLHTTLRDPDLVGAFMTQLARRLEVARLLSEVSSSASVGDHIRGIFSTTSKILGTATSGASSIAIPSALLERMTGTPHRIVDTALHELQSHGFIELERDAIRWLM